MIDQLNSKTFIIFGAGTLAQRVINECEKGHFKVAYILDNDVIKHGRTFAGHIIKNPQNISLEENEIILIASSYSIEIQKQLRKMSLKSGVDYINYNLLFPYVNGDMKFSVRQDELSEIGEVLNYSIDDVGVLLKKGNAIYRAIYSNKVKDTQKILDTISKRNFYNNTIINTIINDKKTENFPLILEHAYIPYCSDSRSWSFSMIRDGFNSIAILLKELRKDNLTLKDAHSLNLTYYDGKYQWIDFGSIIEGTLKENVFKQLLEWFLFPCILMINNQDKAYYEHNYYGGIRYFMIQSFLDEEGKEILDKLYGDIEEKNMYQVLEHIQKWMEAYLSARMMQKTTEWENYQNYTEQSLDNSKQWSKKQKVVFDYIEKCNGNTLIDIAGNNGLFCALASKKLNMSGVLVDYDYKCIENAYQQFKKHNINFIPLVNDFKGFPENMLFLKQSLKFDVVLCLAFIHHLIFSNGFTFERIRDALYKVTGEYLIVEFIEPSDEYVSMWMNPYFTWYNRENFEKVFLDKYSLVSVEDVSESRRVYLMKKNNSKV